MEKVIPNETNFNGEMATITWTMHLPSNRLENGDDGDDDDDDDDDDDHDHDNDDDHDDGDDDDDDEEQESAMLL